MIFISSIRFSRLMVFSCSSVKIDSIWSSSYSFIYKEYTIQGLFFRGRSCPEDIGNMRIFPAFFVFLRIDKTDIYRIIFGCLSSNAPWGSRDNPSHSQCISLSVTFWSSSGVSGQRKQSLSSLFIKIQKPDPSHWRILIEVHLRLQNANMQRKYGSSWNFSLIIAARPL